MAGTGPIEVLSAASSALRPHGDGNPPQTGEADSAGVLQRRPGPVHPNLGPAVAEHRAAAGPVHRLHLRSGAVRE